MTFLNPYYLFAAIGIVVPIAIHLWNRKSGKVIKVGSVKFLEESESSSFSNVRLTEWILLALRIVLILLLSLIMAGTNYLTNNQQPEKMYLIDKALINSPNYSKLVDSLQQYALHLLKPGFPEVGVESNDYIDYWHLIAKMENKQDQEFVVFSSNQIKNFKGKKHMLPSNVEWLYLPVEAQEFIVGAQLTMEDSLIIFTGISDESYLKIEHTPLKYAELSSQFTVDDKEIQLDKIGQYVVYNTDTVAIRSRPIITCKVIYDQKYEGDVSYLTAALNAIVDYGICEIDVEYIKNEGQIDVAADWHIWLTDSHNESEGKNIVYDENVLGTGILDGENLDTYLLAGRINPRFTEVDKLAELPSNLLHLFLKGQFEDRIAKHDVRTIDHTQLTSQLTTNNLAQIDTKSDLSNILWVLFFITLLAERILSFIRK